MKQPRGKPFAKGNPGNRNAPGRPRMPLDLKNVQKISRDQIQRVFAKFSGMDREELQELLKDPRATMLEIMVGSVVARAAKDGDQSRFSFLLDRMVGKVKEEIEHSGSTGSPQVIITLPSNGKEAK